MVNANREIRSRLANIKPKLITSPESKKKWEDPQFFDAYKFDSIQEGVHAAILNNVLTRSRDKFSDFGMRDIHNDQFNRVWTVADGFTRAGRDERPPSWLQPACGWYSWNA